MRRLAVLVLFTAVFAFQATQIADACGDKFLLIGRGIKFQRGYAAIYRANILIVLHLLGVVPESWLAGIG